MTDLQFCKIADLIAALNSRFMPLCPSVFNHSTDTESLKWARWVCAPTCCTASTRLRSISSDHWVHTWCILIICRRAWSACLVIHLTRNDESHQLVQPKTDVDLHFKNAWNVERRWTLVLIAEAKSRKELLLFCFYDHPTPTKNWWGDPFSPVQNRTSSIWSRIIREILLCTPSP